MSVTSTTTTAAAKDFDPIVESPALPNAAQDKDLFEKYNIPRDIQALCLSFLDLPLLAEASLVCKKWNVLSSSDSVWRFVAGSIGLPVLDIGVPYCQQVLQFTRALQNSARATAGKDLDLFTMVRVERPTIADLNNLRRGLKARDIILVWDALVKEANSFLVANLVGPNVSNLNTVEQIINKAEEFSGWFSANKATLRQIVKLNLDGLRLTSLPEEIGQLKELRELNLEDNQLIFLPDVFNDKLETINLRNNQLSSIPSQIKNLPNLKKLLLQHNPLSLASRMVTAFQNDYNSSRTEIRNAAFWAIVFGAMYYPSYGYKAIFHIAALFSFSVTSGAVENSLNYNKSKAWGASILSLWAVSTACLYTFNNYFSGN